MNYNLQTQKAIQEIQEENVERVYLQFPEGLKDKAIEVAEEIEDSTGAVVLIQVDPCYGACDIDEEGIESLGVDLVIHYGHTEF